MGSDRSRKASRPPNGLDDLRVITGMGPSLERWLTASFGVRTYADLAALSEGAVEALAKKQRRRLAGRQIRTILSQARRLARASTAGPRKREASMVERRRTEPDASRDDGWQEFAQFIVYFERKRQNGVEEQRTKVVEQRTGVHHMETGAHDEWPGVTPQNACEWMLKRLPKTDEPVPPRKTGAAATVQSPAGAPNAAAAPTTPTVVFVDVDKVQLYQPPRDLAAQVLMSEGQVFPSYIAADAPMKLEASFSLRRAGGVSAPATPVSCDVAFHIRNRSSAAVTLLGTATGEIGVDGGGAARMTVGGLRAGEYSLEVVVTPRDGYAGGGSSEVPFLRLV